MTNRSGYNRSDRVRKAIMRELGDIFSREINEPELINQVISVTDVEMSPDFRHARVFVSILGDESKRDRALQILQDAQPMIRQEIGRRIRLRYTPEIEIRYDASLERGTRITQLLNQISRGEVD